MRDHLCPIHFSGFFSRFQGGFNFVFESESCIFLFFFLVKFSCMCVSVFFLCRWFQVRHLDRVFLLLFLSISSHWPAWWDCVLTLEVLRDGEDGPCSTIFATVPVNTFQFALYLHCRLNEVNCPSPLLNELFSIDLTQNMAGLPKISDHPLVSSMISAAQRILGRPRDKKDPVTPEMLKALAESKLKGKSPCLSVLTTVATFTVLL